VRWDDVLGYEEKTSVRMRLRLGKYEGGNKVRVSYNQQELGHNGG
jgi:hypothetical protein